MSSLWTPSGEHEVGRAGPEAAPPPPPRSSASSPPAGARTDDLTEEELAEQMRLVQQQMLAAPAAAVVANQCLALYELAALYLSPEPPKLEDARLAIDAMAAVVEGVGSRFGADERALREALSQIRLAFVEAKNDRG